MLCGRLPPAGAIAGGAIGGLVPGDAEYRFSVCLPTLAEAQTLPAGVPRFPASAMQPAEWE